MAQITEILRTDYNKSIQAIRINTFFAENIYLPLLPLRVQLCQLKDRHSLCLLCSVTSLAPLKFYLVVNVLYV